MRYLIVLPLIALLAFCSAPAFADTRLDWKAPTTRVDGTAFSADEIDRFELCANINNDAGCEGPIEYPADTRRVRLDELVDGYTERYFSIRVVDDSGLASDWSDTVLGKLLAPPDTPFLQLTQ